MIHPKCCQKREGSQHHVPMCQAGGSPVLLSPYSYGVDFLTTLIVELRRQSLRG